MLSRITNYYQNALKRINPTTLSVQSNRKWDVSFSVLLIIYIITLSYFSILKLNTFQTTHDLGIFTQSFWTTIFEGKFFFNNLEFYNNGAFSHFGIHISPILILLLPVYALYPGPDVLLISQSILYGIGAIPLYVAAKKVIGEQGSLVISLIYFLYPALLWSNINEFYEISFLPFLLGFFIYGFVFKKDSLILSCGIACLMIKEDISIIIIFASILGLFYHKDYSKRTQKIFISLLIISSIWLILAFTIIMPHFISLSEGISNNPFLPQYYSSLTNISTGIIPRGEYLFQVFYPLLFLPLISPELLILAIPSFAEILLSATYSDIQYHFTPLIIPPLFFALIMTLKKIKIKFKSRIIIYKLLLLVLVVNAILCCIIFSPLQQTMGLMYLPEENHADSDWFRQGAAFIPPDAVVSTQSNLYSLFADRTTIIEGYSHDPEYIVLHLDFPQCQIFVDDFTEIAELYSPVYQKEQFYVLKRK
jgi:uncharacterized membrane protein